MIFYIVGGVLALLLGFVFVKSFKLIFKILINSIIGGFILLLFNLFGAMIGLNIDITPVSSLLVGFLGVPGLIIILILKYII